MRDVALVSIDIFLVLTGIVMIAKPQLTPRKYFPAHEDPGDRESPWWILRVRIGGILIIVFSCVFLWMIFTGE